MARKIRFEALYPHPLKDVWSALTDSDAMAEWLMPNDFAPVVGHKFQFRTKPAPGFNGVVDCEVLAIDPEKRLAISWRGGGIDTVVTFDIAPTSGGTKLIMEQTGFKGPRGLMVSTILKGGWKRMIEQRLPAAAARFRNGVYRADPGDDLAQCHKDV